MSDVTPTVDLIRRRIRRKIDGRPGSIRGVSPQGRKAHYSGRAYQAANMGLRWVALGYTDVEVRLGLGRSTTFKPYPASREEAERACRELADQRSPFASQWRRFVRRLGA